MNFKEIYEKQYKKLIIIPVLILLLSLAVLANTKLTTGEFVEKDISLKGGLLITIQTEESLDIDQIQAEIQSQIGASARVKQLKNIGGGVLGYTIEADSQDIEQLKTIITKATNFQFTEGTYTIEEMSAALSETFFQSAIRAIIIAFILMAVVVFIYFRKIIPSLAVILAAVTDILGVLAFMNITSIKLSTAGIAAILMLIGYSIDTDILLSTKVLKRTEGTIMDRIYSAMKTGMTMQITTLVAMIVIIIISPAAILKQIALVMVIGLLIDIPSTWLQNTGLLRWYLERKNVED
jgi:preprotein translocase subunit SecF